MVSTQLLAPQARAYSYLRFSTPEQMEGDSLRRQTDLATDYARRHGLVLDEHLTFRDLGVSAFRSSNANVGKLGEFLEAVNVGHVPEGSFLLVESLDRISRDYAFDAQSLLSDMIRKGVKVVTLLDERVYSLEGLRQDPMGMMYSIMGFMRANEESQVKSRRLKQVWSNKRATASTRRLTSKSPAWLTPSQIHEGFELIPERAALVERIYTMTLEGAGQHKIAETFNREGLPTWGRSSHWQRSYIAKVLGNSAVVGTLVPHEMEFSEAEKGEKRRTRKPTEPLLRYYPPAISDDLYASVQALRASQGPAPRGRQASAPISNILAGIAACPLCGRSMTRVQKGARSTPALVCTTAKAGAGCTYKSLRYLPIEERLIRYLPEALRDQDGLTLPDDLEDEIWQADQTVDALREQVFNLLDSIGQQTSPALLSRLGEREAALIEAQRQLKDLRDRRDTASGKVIASRIARVVAALQPKEDQPFDRAEANRALRGLFTRAVINWPKAIIEMEWTLGGVCEVPYGWRTD